MLVNQIIIFKVFIYKDKVRQEMDLRIILFQYITTKYNNNLINNYFKQLVKYILFSEKNVFLI